MSLRRRLKYLLPSKRRSEEREMQEELEALKAMAKPGELGNLTLAAENARSVWGWTAVEEAWKDLRHGFRMMGRSSAFATVAVLSLALGIGANTAVFSVIDALLLKPLPVEDPERLVIFRAPTERGNAGITYPVFEQFRARSTSFAGIIAHGEPATSRMSEGSDENFDLVRLDQVSANFFEVLGVNALVGRTFPEDSEPQQALIVISYGLWQRRFGQDPEIIGKTVRLSGRPATIIGVTPPEFRGIEVGRHTDVWLPIERVVMANPQLKSLNTAWLILMARLAPGQSIEQAQTEVSGIFGQMNTEGTTPESRLFRLGELRMDLEPGGTGWTPLRERFAKQLIILMSIVGVLLLIGCANVSGLLLSRGSLRRKEIAVRLAIGGGRLRVVRQLLLESASLAGVAAFAGLAFAYWATRLLLSYLPQEAGSFLNASLDARTLLFTTGISVLSVGLFGLVPAFHATKLDLGPMLKDQVTDSDRPRLGLSLNRFNVVFQVALSMILLVDAGLLLRTLHNLRTFDAGFDREDVIQFSINPGAGYSRPQLLAMHQQMLPRLEGLPGVKSVTFSANAMLALSTRIGSLRSVEGYVPEPDERIDPQWFFIAPKFFETVGLRLVMGRGITAEDQNSEIVVINETMAKKYFAGRNPIGRHLDRGGDGQFEIIGVAQDAKYHSLREETPVAVYAPFSEGASPSNAFLLRTAGDRSSLPAAIHQIAKEIDPRILVSDIRTMGEVADSTITQERLVAQLSGFFSLLALFLACIGLFGLLSYNVSRRTKEIGIRIALGARAREIIGAVLRETTMIAGIGIVLGLFAARVLTRFLETLLFDVSPQDTWTMVAAALALVVAAIVAGYFPARRATRVDPLLALRHE